jgi:hypothetical protein
MISLQQIDKAQVEAKESDPDYQFKLANLAYQEATLLNKDKTELEKNLQVLQKLSEDNSPLFQ